MQTPLRCIPNITLKILRGSPRISKEETMSISPLNPRWKLVFVMLIFWVKIDCQ